jgi:hypothetical protein
MRHLLALVFCSLVSSSALAADFAESWREARIRPQDPRLTVLLRDGMTRSATFRALVNRIEASNLIVYVTLSPIMKASLAGKLTWMTRAGAFRYVRATINTEQNTDQMIATLAHELQHAVEVLEDETVRDQRSLQELYKRIGRPSHSGITAGWETIAAQETGFRVRRELVSAAVAIPTAHATGFAQS